MLCEALVSFTRFKPGAGKQQLCAQLGHCLPDGNFDPTFLS